MAQRPLTKLFAWSVQRGLVDNSPVVLVEKPGVVRKRQRTLSPAEVHAVWAASGELGYRFGHFFRLALVLGQRWEEVARMRWVEINEAEGVWTLTGERTKAGRAHVVPLSALAREILREAPRGRGDWVFTALGGRPISGFSKVKARLDHLLAEGEWSGEPWRIHDLRRTMATGLGKLGVSRFIIGRVLNHADPMRALEGTGTACQTGRRTSRERSPTRRS